jgi:hypothetical protein
MLAVMTTPLPLVERKRRQARQRIIQAAEELFRARGFDDVSVGTSPSAPKSAAPRSSAISATSRRSFSPKSKNCSR